MRGQCVFGNASVVPSPGLPVTAVSVCSCPWSEAAARTGVLPGSWNMSVVVQSTAAAFTAPMPVRLSVDAVTANGVPCAFDTMTPLTAGQIQLNFAVVSYPPPLACSGPLCRSVCVLCVRWSASVEYTPPHTACTALVFCRAPQQRGDGASLSLPCPIPSLPSHPVSPVHPPTSLQPQSALKDVHWPLAGVAVEVTHLEWFNASAIVIPGFRFTSQPLPVANIANATATCVGDFNGDGTDEMVVVQRDFDSVLVAFSGADLKLSPPVVLATFSTSPGGHHACLTADFNNDGLLDVVLLHEFAGNTLYVQQPRSTSASPPLLPALEFVTSDISTGTIANQQHLCIAGEVDGLPRPRHASVMLTAFPFPLSPS